MWKIYGEPCAHAPRISVLQAQMLDWSERQKREVFQEAYPLLDIYGQGLLTQPSDSVLKHILAARTAGEVTEVINYEDGRNNKYVFATEPEKALPRMQQMFQGLRKGFSVLARTTPDSARFLVNALPCGEDRVEALCFSPDSTLLATAAGKRVRLWETASGKRRGELCSGTEISTLAFSPDSAQLIGAHAEGWRLWRVADGQMIACGSASNHCPSNARYYYYYGSPSDERLTCNERAGFLHDGASLTEIADAIVTVRDTEHGLPRVTLEHRSKIILARFSADGETLATVQKQYKNQVLLWRIPAIVVQAKALPVSEPSS
jgi:WD40 repeat protein